MKSPLLLALASLFLCQCGNVGGEQTLRGYKLGVMKGGADAAAGLSCTPSRYEAEYSGGEAEDFARGYRKGYEWERR
ncbi:hypothetical protein [Haloferula sp. A504]|uniref:hypothetical protein n=1 Tax=Haloferula sp. A504 TaxID=3373601 RepID=UPI0031BFECD5|nr:hypothetical protein [Verrucomicrobiaceae bacterium E54]